MVLGVEESKKILKGLPELSVLFIYEEADSMKIYSTIKNN
jgi:hypothetical protein